MRKKEELMLPIGMHGPPMPATHGVLPLDAIFNSITHYGTRMNIDDDDSRLGDPHNV